MMWLIWLGMSIVSAISGLMSSRRYLKSTSANRGSITFYHVVAALNYVLFAFGLVSIAGYLLALGTLVQINLLLLQTITCVMNVSIALSALRKVGRILKENGQQKGVEMVTRRLPQQI
ncbi:hypothetical protein [Vitreoscilla stercoraria]|uniref:Uncharacterized protein n=1 Tax=Vitreoscilla stercoraria TaxID=61 RepID=A0ABY4E826_VITST|nr:hypothetical protein [Vitreoscilla stercoraria]UOO91912.1 hypothetical protein LVJ81_09740 [Vitreoscilla stercoraria]